MAKTLHNLTKVVEERLIIVCLNRIVLANNRHLIVGRISDRKSFINRHNIIIRQKP